MTELLEHPQKRIEELEEHAERLHKLLAESQAREVKLREAFAHSEYLNESLSAQLRDTQEELAKLRRDVHFARGYLECDGEAECLQVLERTGIKGHSIFSPCTHEGCGKM